MGYTSDGHLGTSPSPTEHATIPMTVRRRFGAPGGLSDRRRATRRGKNPIHRPAWSILIAVLLGLLSGIIGVASGIAALVAVGGDRAYHSRVGFGWLALAGAIVATLGVLLIARQTRGATALVPVANGVGGVPINLFYINTFSVAAVPCWWLGAAIAWLGPDRFSPHIR